ncbi:MarR family winged helix-turn-helix transcriptional regulator [Pseudoclavibacter sp. 13-3]|uniref:MarR family winged helix-turn-helix transcriptional regulator n=1 Tax=Pseudoclavibacter sp. 13-3 TaxID=2901228 RepID=UPI001E2848F7|nr:MarR family transcriptional regulator [Pseudoclavibacter sp. 13-3]MCD7101658.1 MarR family transcriptional regulator [Pseudoclavibacter sp. 13-3]
MQNQTAIALVHETARFMRNARAVSYEATKAGALNVPLSLVLDALMTHGSCRAAEVGEQIGFTPSVLSRHIAELEEHGLVERIADPDDARARIVTVTERGRTRLHESQRLRAQRLIDRIGVWDEAQAAGAVQALSRVSDRLERGGSEAAAPRATTPTSGDDTPRRDDD